MAQTHTQVNTDGVFRMITGRFLDTGTVADTTIDCGFKPRYVHIMNNTSGDEEYWAEGMADDSAMKRVAAGTGALITSNGITPTTHGFILGLDTDILVSGEQITYVAIG